MWLEGLCSKLSGSSICCLICEEWMQLAEELVLREGVIIPVSRLLEAFADAGVPLC